MYAHSAAGRRDRGPALSRSSCATIATATTCPIWQPSCRRFATVESADDGKTIVVHLRQGVEWADGVAADRARLALHLSRRHAIRATTSRRATAGTTSRRRRARSLHDRHSLEAAVRRRARHPRDGRSPAIRRCRRIYWQRSPTSTLRAFNSQPLSSGPYLLQGVEPRIVAGVRARTRATCAAPPELKEIDWKIVPDANTLFNQLRRTRSTSIRTSTPTRSRSCERSTGSSSESS